MNTLKFIATSNTEIVEFTDYDIWGRITSIVWRLLMVVYHIAPIVILLFIAIVVWRIYEDGKKEKNEEKYH